MRSVIVAVLLFLGACVPMHAPQHKLIDTLEQETIALVELDEDSESGVHVRCSGVWVSDHTILTARHCVADANLTPLEKFLAENDPFFDPPSPVGGTVLFSVKEDMGTPSKTRTSVVTKVDDTNDLATLYVIDAPMHPYAYVAAISPDVGDEVHIEGHTMGQPWTYLHGFISAYRPKMSGPHDRVANELQVEAPVYFGNSGGGVFDKYGQLVGIASYISQAPDTGYVCPPEEINAFLRADDVKPQKRVWAP